MKTLLVAGLLSSALLSPARSAPAAGWDTRVGKVHACPGVPASRCVQVFSVASTTRWRDVDLDRDVVPAHGCDGPVVEATLKTWMQREAGTPGHA